MSSTGSINPRQRIVIVVMDVLLILELCLAFYLGHGDRAHLTSIFLRTYVPLAAVTVIGGRYLIRRFGRESLTGESEHGAAS
ncbi:MAG TPA: hypothetical protein PKB11_14955 [Desulfovibrio sp.]|jgi:hypothetical protein|uniref:hypothetical protein n=1 Tax=Desulfovibrio TaxID=872 RepID=UPI002A491260|nr:hypothetical protein [Desulfovibrio sp.]MDY0305688.1 hypothetical protein [Desulfovibrionaceae bacterium]HMM40055.1 hypothetical protein [Desulfovibrio sp.]